MPTAAVKWKVFVFLLEPTLYFSILNSQKKEENTKREREREREGEIAEKWKFEVLELEVRVFWEKYMFLSERKWSPLLLR